MLNSWDKMILPKPFGKIVVTIGKAITLSGDGVNDDSLLEKVEKSNSNNNLNTVNNLNIDKVLDQPVIITNIDEQKTKDDKIFLEDLKRNQLKKDIEIGNLNKKIENKENVGFSNSL